jgi:VWFA-related protein
MKRAAGIGKKDGRIFEFLRGGSPFRFWGCFWLILSSMPAWAQNQQGQGSSTGPTLKVETEVVDVYAIVEGKHHNLIPDLQKQDFELTEDGSPQQIKYFTRETETPLTIGLMVDTSPSQEHVLPIEQQQAKAFLDQVMRPKDLTFVLHFDAEVELLQDFTAERRLLAKAIDEVRINGGGQGPVPGTFPGSSTPCCTHLYDAVYLASNELMRNEVGRKVLILLTDGVDEGSKERLDVALEAAQKSNVIIYSIDISDAGFYFTRGFGFGGGGEGTLKKLSEETGGRVIKVKNQKETAAAFQQIADELRTQYLLGYTPSNLKHDGSFRKIRVRVVNTDYKVQARRGYYAPQDRVSGRTDGPTWIQASDAQ